MATEFAAIGRGVKTVERDTMHITLKFLGDTAQSRVERVAEIIAARTAHIAARSIPVRGLDAFPDRERPSIIWAALQDADVLTTLASDLDAALEPEGFACEGRSYTPHLTLGRVRAIKGPSRSRIPDGVMQLMSQHAETDFGTIRLGEVVLYESVLSDSGPTYTRLATSKLD